MGFLLVNLENDQKIKFKTITAKDGLSNNSVNDIVSDQDGVLWIATWDGVNLYDGNSFKVFNHITNDSTSISSNEIFGFIKDFNEDIWVKTNSSSVSKYIGNNKFKNYFFEEYPEELFLSKTGNIIVWFKNSDSYFEFKNNKFIRVEKNNINQKSNVAFDNFLLSKHPNLIITNTLQDAKGNIWYATKYNGLYIIPNISSNINNDLVEHYEYDLYSPYSFKSNEITVLHEDIFGNIWLGHKDGGLSMAHEGSGEINLVTPHPVKQPNLPNESIRAITKDFKSNIWLGYYTKGLYYLNPKTKTYVKYEITKASNNNDWERIRSLYSSSDGSVWVGTYAGLICIKNGVSTFYSAEDYKNLPNNRNYSISEDKKKQLWIACWGGLAKFNLNTQKFETFKGQEKLKNLNIRKVVAYEDEIIVGTEKKGVVRLNNKTADTSEITVKKGILENSVYTVIKDKETNYYWIASLAGISIYDLNKGLIKNITRNEGLPSHLVYSLILSDDKVWISTTKGIAVINKNNFSVSSFNPDEGWQAEEFSEGAYFKDIKGTLFFGGIYGLNYFHPSSINFSKDLPKIKVFVDHKEKFDTTVFRNYSENDLRVEISRISFSENTNNKILYKLVGYEKDWKIFNGNPIFYKNLPYGSYTLRVKNSLANNDENNLAIIIKKPFYLTLWFIVLVVLIISGGILCWLAIDKRKVIRHKKMLEQRIEQRTQIINSQKQDLVYSNLKLDKKNKEITEQKEQLLKLNHQYKNEDFEIDKFKTFVFAEFKPVITNILQNSSHIENQDAVKQAILNQSGELINLLTEWEHLSQVKNLSESKKSAVKLNSIIKFLINGLKPQMFKSKINFNSILDINDEWIKLDVLQFRMLFKYLFNEVIKYSSNDSNLKLAIKNDEEFISLKVTTDSKLLLNNFHSVQHYSPYFRAVDVIIKELGGKFDINVDTALHFKIKIPIDIVNIDNNIEEVRWSHENMDKELLPNKNNILVFCDEDNSLSAKQLLEDDDNDLLFENSANESLAVLKHKNIDLLVLYNAPITDKLIQLFSCIKALDFKIAIPIVYISEQINYFLQEETLELGVDAYIQLPINRSFIKKKLHKLLEVRKNYLRDHAKQQLFNITTEQSKVFSPNEKLIKQALDVIKDNIQTPSFNLETLTYELKISKMKCYRAFKEVLTQSPSDVIINLRMQKAEYLLKDKSLNISEISYACGFNDPKYFSRLFRKSFDCSPKEYRNAHV